MKYLLLPLMLIDCLLNLIIGSHKINETLSATAARVRASQQPYWGWWANVIDKLFAVFGWKDHCNRQLQGEAFLGGAWGVWRSL